MFLSGAKAPTQPALRAEYAKAETERDSLPLATD